MKTLTARLERLEAITPRDTGQTPEQRRFLRLIVNDADALEVAERLRALRDAGTVLTHEQMLALPGVARVLERLRAKAEAEDRAAAEGRSPWP